MKPSLAPLNHDPRKLANRAATLSLGLAILTLLAACAPQAPAAQTNQPGQGQDPAAQAAPDPATIPDSLKHNAFKFYGLDDTSERSYTFDVNGTVQTGTQKQTFEGIDSQGAAIFRITRTGALADLGTDVIAVKPEGVFLIESRGQKIEPPLLALPANAEVGASWPTKQPMTDAQNQEVTIDATQKIAKQEKVSTPAGEFDAIVVTMDGTLRTASGTRPVKGTAWYAAGVGTVKLTLSSQDEDKKPVGYTITLAKPQENTANPPAQAGR